MSEIAELELGYRRWLRWYPASFRREYEAEMLGVLLAHARADQRRPQPIECLDLMSAGVRMRLRPTVPRSDRSAFTAVRLMYVGALVELATAIIIVATAGDIKSAILKRNRGYSEAQWHAEVAGSLRPLVVGAGIAIGFWLWMAWANGRGYRWARIVFAIFFGTTTFSMIHGLAGGSAAFARTDLVIGVVLWLVQLTALVLIFHKHMPTVAVSR